MAGRIKKKLQSIFRCTDTMRDTISNKASTSASTGTIFHGSNENFIRNGGVLLEERVSLFHGKTNPIHCLSVDDLNTAFDVWIFYEKGVDWSWYKCVWEGRPVLVKLFHPDLSSRYELLKRSCREIAIATQMGIHKNVHKLLACCLETEYPVLVYEYLGNGLLSNYIRENSSPLELKERLKIAWEISHAVAYLNYAFPRPIIHRSLTIMSVFLDQDNTAKLSDFSLSISIPKGKTHVEDIVMGTYGYAAPEYVTTGWLGEKADVYSFGMVFLALLTGENPHSLIKEEQEDFKCWTPEGLKDERISNIVDSAITESGVIIDEELKLKLQASVELIHSCRAGEFHRPKMVNVAAKLRSIMSTSDFVPSTISP